MRAQSETIGFVLVFALIVSTIGVIYGTGTAGLQSAQRAEQTQNVERAFEVLDENVGALRDGVPSRSTEISLNGGTLALGEPIRVRIYAVSQANTSRNTSYTTRITPVVYTRGETSITYVNGAIIRSDRGAARLLSRPRWLVDAERAVLPSLTTYSGNGTSAVGGEGTARVTTIRRSGGLAGSFEAGADDVRVNVTVESPRAAAWATFFETEGYTALDDDPSDGTVTYQFVTAGLYIHRTSIELQVRS